MEQEEARLMWEHPEEPNGSEHEVCQSYGNVFDFPSRVPDEPDDDDPRTAESRQSG